MLASIYIDFPLPFFYPASFISFPFCPPCSEDGGLNAGSQSLGPAMYLFQLDGV